MNLLIMVYLTQRLTSPLPIIFIEKFEIALEFFVYGG
jgi:hypothetical protein